MSIDPKLWMPPEMDPADKQGYLLAHPDDPHTAAAEAWEAWAATLTVSAPVLSASTGVQSASYGDGGSGAFQEAQARARWHRTRARGRAVHALSMNEEDPLMGGAA